MWEEEELSDEDLRSVYGDAAVQRRSRAFYDRLLKNQDASLRRLDALLQRQQNMGTESKTDG